jgi:hypothetical protein
VRREARRETDVSDTFLDSAWYFLRYPSANRDDVPFDPEITGRWLPVHMYIGGKEHAVLHLLYAASSPWCCTTLGHIDFEEPFRQFRAHGLLIKEGSKMSKSRGNVVIPDRYLEEWGADTFRTYLMFLGPYQEGGDFRDQGLQGPFGFLHRLWDAVVPVEELGSDAAVRQRRAEAARHHPQGHRRHRRLRYNTAIAAMMEYLNAVREGNRRVNRARSSRSWCWWRRSRRTSPRRCGSCWGTRSLCSPAALAGVGPGEGGGRHRRVRRAGERQGPRAHAHGPRHLAGGRAGGRPGRRERAQVRGGQSGAEGRVRARPAAEPCRG